jgi:hypothetical protein
LTLNDKSLRGINIIVIKYFFALEFFAEKIFDEKMDGLEYETIPLRDFTEVSLKIFKLEEKHIQAISVLLSDHFIGESFDFNFFEEIFRQMGVV